MMVPLVSTPSELYMGPLGFFFTPRMSSWNVHLSSGWVMCALVKRRPEGRMKRSYLGGLRVKPGPTKVALVMMRFQLFFWRLPLRMTRNISSSAMGRTFGSGTSHFPAFSLRFCLMVLDSTLARLVCSRSSRYAGMAPGATSSSTLCLLARSLCCWMVFFIVTFSLCRFLAYSLALRPMSFCATADRLWGSRASFLRLRS
mmetsp:Transcript_34586/g.84698  ORF Transcript_34586/g.84698 Transcript_34586/m.84698 type:complete len:200 (-) Transcript_34586:305-904(-)